MKDEYYMKMALKEAEIAYSEGEIPVGAVIVAGGRIIARAHNQTERLNDCTAHAEMIAITAACEHLGNKYLGDCCLYVSLEPCPMCAAALNWAKIGKVVFGAFDEKSGYRRFQPNLLHGKTELVCGLMQEEGAELMQRFFRERRD